MIEYLARIPVFRAARRLGLPPSPPPLSLALCVTHRCNARCLTCNIASSPAPELSVADWQRIFRGIGKTVPWFTVTGGEPFIREDLPDLLDALLSACRPKFLTIPTNGAFPDAALAAADVFRAHTQTRVALNFSIDAPRELNDRIRGFTGAFDSSIETFRRLSRRRPPNLRLGVHTVISRFNAAHISELAAEMKRLKPDTHFFEVAQPRRELAMEDIALVPDAENLKRALAVARGRLRAPSLLGAFRKNYYRLVKSSLCGGGRMPPCYAGIASAYVAPDGTLFPCPERPVPMGNLLEADSFHGAWRSAAAARARADIKREDCRCTLANTAYTNMLLSAIG